MRPALLLAAALLLSGCLASGTTPPPEPAADATEVPVVETDVSYRGRFALRACTFGSIRHECNGGMVPGFTGAEELHVLSFEGAPVRLVGALRIVDEPAKSHRVDAFLMHRAGDDAWEVDFPRDPYSSGPSPVAIDWDLAPYAGEDLAVYVFTSEATAVGPVGVSVEPPQDFAVDARLVTTV